MLFGHSQQVWTCFGHLLDIFLTIDIFWSLFWTLLTFLRPKCVRPLIVLEHPRICHYPYGTLHSLSIDPRVINDSDKVACAKSLSVG